MSLFYLLIHISGSVVSQIKIDKVFNINDNDIYIVARGTKSKQGFIAKKFNILNDSITHIGIGLKADTAFRVYNVNPVRNTNALFIESFESFINLSDLVYVGLWRLKLKESQKRKTRRSLAKLSRKIDFDFDFVIDETNDQLYCSEFCWLVTDKLGRSFKYPLRELNTKEVDMDRILKRDILKYVPVDYFLTFESLEKIETWSDRNFKF